MKTRTNHYAGRWHWLLLVVLLTGTLLLVPRPGQTQAAEPQLLDVYVAQLQAARAALRADAPSATALTEARGLLTIRTVRLPNGTEVRVVPLVGEAGDSLTRAQAAVRVESVLAQLAAAADDEHAARLAILASLVARSQTTAGESWLERLLRWLDELLNGWLPDAPATDVSPATRPAERLLGWLLAGVGAVLLVWLLSYWLQGLLRSMVTEAAVEHTGDADDEAMPLTPAAARQYAERQAAAGNYRSAVRQLYLAALLILQERGLASRDRSLTNREVLARIPQGHPVHPPMQPVIDTFDDVWYGMHEPDQETFTQYTQAIDQVETAAQRRDEQAGGT